MSTEPKGLHPCPMPSAGPRDKRDPARSGDLWACECGKVYVRRSEDWGNWAGNGTDWRWEPTALRIDASAP